jgi:hypothetical protein
MRLSSLYYLDVYEQNSSKTKTLVEIIAFYKVVLNFSRFG